MHYEILENNGEPLMNNLELYSLNLQIIRTLKTRALTNKHIECRPKSASKWHPFQWEALSRQTDPVKGGTIRFFYTLLSIPPCWK